MDGGAIDPPGFEHAPGETLFFSLPRSGLHEERRTRRCTSTYSVQAFDPKGVPLTEIYKNEMMTDVTPQDKEWMPKIATEVQIPPLIAGAGTYKIVVKVEDVVAKTTAELAVPFQVRGYQLEPSDTLVVRNFHFFRGGGGHAARGEGGLQSGRQRVGAVRHHRVQVRAEEQDRRELL